MARTAPRQFYARNPSLSLQVTTSHDPVDFERGQIDAAIHSGETSGQASRASACSGNGSCRVLHIWLDTKLADAAEHAAIAV